MANKHRGEVDITIGGTTYSVAMTIDAFARLAEVVDASTVNEMSAIALTFPPRMIPDMVDAILQGNGITVEPASLKRLHVRSAIDFIGALFAARPETDEDDEPADPQKRAS